MYKKYMVVLYWEATMEHEIFYFDSLDAVQKFSKTEGVRLEKVFELVDVTKNIL